VKINWVNNDGYGRYGLRAVPGEYDAVPMIDSLLFDGTPAFVSNDRLSTAAVLAFREHVSGQLELPRDVTPEVASEIQNFLLPRAVFPTPISFPARAMPDGEGRLVLNLGAEVSPVEAHNEWGRPREVLFDLRPSSEWAGLIASVDRVSIATNAKLFGMEYAENDIRSIYSSIAVALIFAESFKARTIVVPRKYDSNIDAVDALSQLLSRSAMGLEFQ